MNDQLPLDLAFEPSYGDSDFLVTAANADAYATLTRWPDWPGRVMLLVGPEGAGKSHLARIWATQAGARHLDASAMPCIDSSSAAEHALLIDDADRCGASEATLFHRLNRLRETETFLLMTARTPPDRWGLTTPDLLSRLRVAPVLRLEAPDDALMRAVLVKLFIDRQLFVDSTVVDYVALRLDRSLGAARDLVEALDRASLASHRRITRPIAAEVLATLAS